MTQTYSFAHAVPYDSVSITIKFVTSLKNYNFIIISYLNNSTIKINT